MKIEYMHRDVAVRTLRSTPAGVLLRPAALVYRFASFARKKRMGKGHGPALPDGAVISVGNIEVGGGGKTPFCIYLLSVLTGEGRRPVHVSRGYKSEAEKMQGMTTVVLPRHAKSWPRTEPGVRFLTRDTEALSDIIGDEGAMVAERNPGVPMVISGDKAGALRKAADLFRPSHIILDDAFQSWGVHRNVDIVLLDAKRPFGNGRLLPAGTLREGVSALGRADAIGLNGIDNADDLSRAAAIIRQAVDTDAEMFGIARTVRFFTTRGREEVPVRDPVASLSSIARPAAFDRMLERCGCDVRLSIRFPDHFRYRTGDIAAIRRRTALERIRCLVTTEKDWVKLRNFEWRDPEIVIARLELAVQPDAFLEKIKKPRASLAASI